MTYHSALKLTALLISVSLMLFSCNRVEQIPGKAFRLTTNTFYRISPKAPETIIINGTSFIGTAFFPGGGTGNATHMGRVKMFFNQQAYSDSEDGLPLGSVAAAVIDIPDYPVTGAPLPLIQDQDFAELPAVNSTLRIPAQVEGRIINTVIYNNQGDAVFLSAITGSGGTFPISETKVGFNGKALIVTGRGKFKHAVGEVDYEGFFNLVDANDAGFNAEGWIYYRR